jgi:hypothetical protein
MTPGDETQWVLVDRPPQLLKVLRGCAGGWPHGGTPRRPVVEGEVALESGRAPELREVHAGDGGAVDAPPLQLCLHGLVNVIEGLEAQPIHGTRGKG